DLPAPVEGCVSLAVVAEAVQAQPIDRALDLPPDPLRQARIWVDLKRQELELEPAWLDLEGVHHRSKIALARVQAAAIQSIVRPLVDTAPVSGLGHEVIFGLFPHSSAIARRPGCRTS